MWGWVSRRSDWGCQLSDTFVLRHRDNAKTQIRWQGRDGTENLTTLKWTGVNFNTCELVLFRAMALATYIFVVLTYWWSVAQTKSNDICIIPGKTIEKNDTHNMCQCRTLHNPVATLMPGISVSAWKISFQVLECIWYTSCVKFCNIYQLLKASGPKLWSTGGIWVHCYGFRCLFLNLLYREW